MGETYNINTGEERLVVAVILALELCPVLHLNGRIGASGDTLEPLELVTLVAWIDIGDVLYDLIIKVGLCSGVCRPVSKK